MPYCVKAADDAQVDAEEKYGIPPEVPATVKAGVVVAVATDTNPPVQLTEVTVPSALSVDHAGTPPDTIKCCPVVPIANLLNTLVALAYRMSPVV